MSNVMKYLTSTAAFTLAAISLHANAAEPKVMTGNISDNIDYKGDLIIKGDVAPKVTVTVRDGGLRIEGNVGDGATITQRESNISSNGGNVVIRQNGGVSITSTNGGSISVNGGVVTINGKVVKPDENNSNKLQGIEIKGTVGKKAKIDGSSSLVAGNIGAETRLKAGNTIQTGDISDHVEARAGNSVTVSGNVGAGSKVNAGNSIIVAGNACSKSFLDAGNSVTAGGYANGTIVRAGNSIAGAIASPTAQLDAGNASAIAKRKSFECQ